MLVKDLLKILQGLPSDLEIFIDTGEDCGELVSASAEGDFLMLSVDEEILNDSEDEEGYIPF